ncbi:MAG: tRNA uridine-5-carboxymethylaminomethyl(34) synthesis GTPase MnmE [Oscillospiraceae bacterium]|nr:tRNA uridine-5-carboxymethylaminomethyl(34) synthesis GTPase MnmE [Oscillospiraceae bacterium]
MNPQTDTIAAIATPSGTGGIAVIRISGADAITRAAQIFSPVRGKSPLHMDGYTCSYGYIRQDGEILDDCVLTIFRAPYSYTGEDVVEISCHGGRYLTQKILRTVLCRTVRLAEAGEFTKRAFLNGKLSLTQAEAVADLISASGENAVKCARTLRDGATFRKISEFSVKLLEILSSLAVWADYPDEDIPEVNAETLEQDLSSLMFHMEHLLESYDYGRILREGLHTVIIGKPNAGKSTLFNALAGCERSIVTEIAGTTRDVVEEQVRIGDVTLRLSDTAGVHETSDRIEQIGVEKSLASIRQADLILAVFDQSEPFSSEDQTVLEQLLLEKTILIGNKNDKALCWEFSQVLSTDSVDPAAFVGISAKSGQFPELEQAIAAFASRKAVPAEDGMIANERQRDCLRFAVDAVHEALEALRMGMAYDAVTVSLDAASDALLQLTGERVTDKVVDMVFARFCVGK